MHRVSLCLLALFVLACGGTTEPEPLTIRVEGTVTAADDGSPVVGAEVVVFQFGLFESRIFAEGLTDTSGRYSLSFVNTGCTGDFATLAITHPDFFFEILARVLIGEVVSCTEELQTIDVQLGRV